MSTTLTPTYGTKADLAVTALNSLANSATAGWQSDIIDNRTLKASDFLLFLKTIMTGTPANDKALYVYAVPWYHDGTSWLPGGDGGTATALSSAGQATFTIASPNNLGPPIAILNYTAAGTISSEIKLSNRFGSIIPQGFQLVVINYTGVALQAAGNNQISYVPITYLSV
jgi:hypothetical protein